MNSGGTSENTGAALNVKAGFICTHAYTCKFKEKTFQSSE